MKQELILLETTTVPKESQKTEEKQPTVPTTKKNLPCFVSVFSSPPEIRVSSKVVLKTSESVCGPNVIRLLSTSSMIQPFSSAAAIVEPQVIMRGFGWCRLSVERTRVIGFLASFSKYLVGGGRNPPLLVVSSSPFGRVAQTLMQCILIISARLFISFCMCSG